MRNWLGFGIGSRVGVLRTAAVLSWHRQAEQAHLAELAHDAWLGAELGIGVGLATW